MNVDIRQVWGLALTRINTMLSACSIIPPSPFIRVFSKTWVPRRLSSILRMTSRHTLLCHGMFSLQSLQFKSSPRPTFRSLKEIRAAIPSQFFVRDTPKGLLYLARDLLMATAVWSLATYIDPYFKGDATKELLTPVGAEVARWAAWGV